MESCIICHSTHSKPLYAGIVECEACGHVFSDLDIDGSQMRRLYDRRYFFGDEYKDYLADRKVFEKNFRLRLKVLQKFLDPKRHRRLLEIGCAYGFFLEAARGLFDSVYGIDVTEDGIRYAQEQLKLDAVNAELLTHDLGGRKFDVVCMWDTIEHLMSPQLYLEKVARHTDSGALIAMTTGDIESVIARVQKDKWRLIHPPTHVHYFSRKALAALLGAYGFDVIYDRYCGFYRSVDLAAYRVFVMGKKAPWLYALLKRCGLTGVDFYSNLYDIAYIIARKR